MFDIDTLLKLILSGIAYALLTSGIRKDPWTSKRKKFTLHIGYLLITVLIMVGLFSLEKYAASDQVTHLTG